jgi:hypothetical protein
MEPMSRLPSDPPLELGSEHRLDRLHVTLLVSVSMSKFFVQQASPAIIFQLSRPLRMLRKRTGKWKNQTARKNAFRNFQTV